MNKTLRQRALLDALKHGSVSTQEDLQRVLRKRGFKVGQATLSRDIHDLNLSKTSHGYSLSQGDNSAGLALPPRDRAIRLNAQSPPPPHRLGPRHELPVSLFPVPRPILAGPQPLPVMPAQAAMPSRR